MWSDRNLLLLMGKMLFVFCPILLTVHLWLASTFNNFQASVQMCDNIPQELMENQAGLMAKRDQMLLPERMRVIAAEKLALHVPDKEQITLVR
jgi:hypothetical protein